MQTVTPEYLLGIKEGREYFKKYGGTKDQIADQVENLNSTIRGFAASSPVGQMLRGERDFWLNQAKTA